MLKMSWPLSPMHLLQYYALDGRLARGYSCYPRGVFYGAIEDAALTRRAQGVAEVADRTCDADTQVLVIIGAIIDGDFV